MPPGSLSSGGIVGAPVEYRLSGHHLHVEYMPEAPGPIPVGGGSFVSYQDSVRSLSFKGVKEVESVETEAGQMISVVIVHTVDIGDTAFSFLVPRVNLEGETSVPVRTVGITTIHRTGLAPGLGRGQTDSYTTVTLSGTASGNRGIIPLGTN
jgi:hypothetical protein